MTGLGAWFNAIPHLWRQYEKEMVVTVVVTEIVTAAAIIGAVYLWQLVRP